MSEAKREPVDYMFQFLNWDFLRDMARICKYAAEKYGSTDQYCDGPLHGEKSPVNHLINHTAEYIQGKPHDHFGTRKMQLVVIAYNAMMEYKYLEMGIEEPVNKVNEHCTCLFMRKDKTDNWEKISTNGCTVHEC